MVSQKNSKAKKAVFDEVFERIKRATDIKTVKELAIITGAGYDHMLRKRKKGEFSAEWAFATGQHFDISTDWIMTGKDSQPVNMKAKQEATETAVIANPSEYDQREIEYIPINEASLSARGGAFADSELVRDYYAFKKDWLMKTVTAVKNAVLVGVIGNSMEPTIYNGDVVMVDTGRANLYDGNIYAMRLNDTIMIKRLSLRPNEKIEVVSDNKTEHASYTASRKEIHIIGQIVWYARSLVSVQ